MLVNLAANPFSTTTIEEFQQGATSDL